MINLFRYTKTLFFSSGLILYGACAFAGGGHGHDDFPDYNLSVFFDMSPTSAFAQANCPGAVCNVEGNVMDDDGNLYLAMASPNGKIYKVTRNGQASLYASFDITVNPPLTFSAVNFRMVMDKRGNIYTAFRNIDANQTPTEMNGAWKIPPGGGECKIGVGPCTKIWPLNYQTITPQVRFLDGVALDEKGGYLYVGDAQMGNIWKVKLSNGNGVLWAGTDAGSNPNYLIGDPQNFLLGSPIVGRGLGVIAIDLDKKADYLYASNFDNGQVIQIPIKSNGTAGKQKLLLDLSSQDKQLDALHIDDKDNLYVTLDQVNFKAFTRFLGCQFGVPGFVCPAPFVNFADGHEVLAASVKNPNDVDIESIINNPILGVTTGVTTGVKNEKDTLYLDVFSTEDGSGARVVKAVPDDDHGHGHH